jgi:hypothetical protein
MSQRKKINRNNRQRGKAHQKKTADALNGIDIGILGGVDVIDKEFSVECKSRQKFVGRGWMDQCVKNNKKAFDKTPLIVVHEKGKQYKNDLVLMRIADFKRLFGRLYEDKDCTD